MERHRLVQTLIINDLGEILLCKWHDGPCAGKYTACLGDAIEGESDEASAAAVVRALAGLTLDVARFEEVALFAFESTDGDGAAVFDADEVEFVYRARRRECAGRRDSADASTSWFPLDAIPYAEMPADDALWYPRVLGGAVLEGRFRFDGDVLVERDVRERRSS